MKVILRKYFLNHHSGRQRYTVSWTDNCLAEIKASESFHMVSLVFKFWFLISFTACLSASEVSDVDFKN